MKRRHCGGAGSVIAALALGGCVVSGLPTTVFPPDNVYACQDGKPMRVLLAPDRRSVEVIFGDRRTLMPRVDSAAQAKFSNGASTLYLDGQNAVFTSDSFVVAGPCVSAQPLPSVILPPS